MNDAVRRTPQEPAADLYPTRGTQERILERVDPVIYGTGRPRGAHSLTAAQLEAYARDGYLVVPGVFSGAEVERFRSACAALEISERLADRPERVLEPDSRRARSIFNPQQFDPLFARLARDRRILDKIMQVLDSAVYIHHARVNIKRALNGKSFPWHADFETWHAEDGLPRCRVLSAWVMLTDNDEFNGPLYVVPGSHRHFVSCAGATPHEHYTASLRRQEYGVPSRDALRRLSAERGLAAAHGAAGTLVLHEGNTLHGSADNLSPTDRTNLFFVYNSVHNTPAERPFAADAFRPEFLASRMWAPLRPVDERLD